MDEDPHLRIVNGAVCRDKRLDQPCLYFCRANAYRLEKDRITLAYEGYPGCGSCRIGCSHLNIEWRFPKEIYGISHELG